MNRTMCHLPIQHPPVMDTASERPLSDPFICLLSTTKERQPLICSEWSIHEQVFGVKEKTMRFESHSFPSRRSSVIARHGLVATSQPLAAQAGLAVLQAGGNAVDAAIATVATLCVVEPCSTGIGGDAFALIWMADEQKLYGLNASGPAPMNLSAAEIRGQGHSQMPEPGGAHRHRAGQPARLGTRLKSLGQFGAGPAAGPTN
jgi:hypothetical protein